uniref:Uncharacterized protein n=1 Tax=Uncultured archaeon GZfos26G2 TaxID=3386331 RepID=Q64CU7_UNCAG|nr:hypothetical protein GZ1C11_11 [uncultured archaeon GZfos1C11]
MPCSIPSSSSVPIISLSTCISIRSASIEFICEETESISTSATMPTNLPFSITGSFLIFPLAIFFTISDRRSFDDAVIIGAVMTSFSFTTLGGMSLLTSSLSISPCVTMPSGLPLLSTTILSTSYFFIRSGRFRNVHVPTSGHYLPAPLYLSAVHPSPFVFTQL